MSRGHGTPGLLDYLRNYYSLASDQNAARRPFLEYAPGVELESWITFSGATYGFYGQVQFLYNGSMRDIVGVATSLGRLVRMPSLALCIATAGTFYASVGSAPDTLPVWDDGTVWDGAISWDTGGVATTAAFWDDGVTDWDDGTLWDAYTAGLDLYVHMPDDADPADETLIAELGFYFAAKGEVYPKLGPNLFTNGDFEVLDGLVESKSGTGFETEQSSSVYIGRGSTKSLRLSSTGAATGQASRYRDVNTAQAEMHVLYGDYMTGPDQHSFSSNLAVRLLVQDVPGTLILYEDGRDADANGQVTLRPTWGEWRRFEFYFLAPAGTTRAQLQLRAASSPGSGDVHFDNIELRPVYGFWFYDPRLDAGSLPEVEVASLSQFFDGSTVGLGAFSLLDGDNVLAPIFGQLLLTNRPAKAFVGGKLPDGQETYRSDWRGAWPGVTQKVLADDTRITFETEDGRGRIHTQLPLRQHSLKDSPDMDLNKEGYARMRVFAEDSWDGVNPFAAPIFWRPIRVGLTAEGYPIYEVGNVERSLDGMHADDPIVLIYQTEEEAAKVTEWGSQVLSAQSGVPCWSYDRATGLLTVLTHIGHSGRPKSWNNVSAVNFFKFDVGGGTLSVSVDTGTWQSYSARAVTLQTAMRAAAAVADIFVVFNTATKKFTISKTAGTLNIRFDDTSRELSELWGFDTSSDKTASLSYTSDYPTLVEVDSEIIIILAAKGLRDDAAGSVTGTANSPVYLHPDVARYILQQDLQVPEDDIRVSTFEAGRAYDTVGTRFVLYERESSGDVLGKITSGARAELVVDGDGLWNWQPYRADAPVMREFYDRDFLSFETIDDPASVFRSAVLSYGHHPLTRATKTIESTYDPGVPVKYGRVGELQVRTWIDGTAALADVEAITDSYAQLAALAPKPVAFTCRGKAVDLLRGDIVALTRARAMTNTGALAAARFRVLRLRHNQLSGVSTVVVVPDVDFTT